MSMTHICVFSKCLVFERHFSHMGIVKRAGRGEVHALIGAELDAGLWSWLILYFSAWAWGSMMND